MVTMRLQWTESEKASRPLRAVSEYDLVVALHEMNTSRADCWGFPAYPQLNGVYGRNWIKRELKYKEVEAVAPAMMPLLVTIDVT